jgi:hypothetical protein
LPRHNRTGVEGTLSEHTDRSLRHTVKTLSDDNMYSTIKLIEIPSITTGFELTVQAMRAPVTAPSWLENLKDAELLGRIERMKELLRERPSSSAGPRGEGAEAG